MSLVLGIYYDHYGRDELKARYHRFRWVCAEALHRHLRYLWQSPEWCRFFFSEEHIDFVDPIDELHYMTDRLLLPPGHTMLRRREWLVMHPADRLKHHYHLELSPTSFKNTIDTLHTDPWYQVHALVLS